MTARLIVTRGKSGRHRGGTDEPAERRSAGAAPGSRRPPSRPRAAPPPRRRARGRRRNRRRCPGRMRPRARARAVPDRPRSQPNRGCAAQRRARGRRGRSATPKPNQPGRSRPPPKAGAMPAALAATSAPVRAPCPHRRPSRTPQTPRQGFFDFAHVLNRKTGSHPDQVRGRLFRDMRFGAMLSEPRAARTATCSVFTLLLWEISDPNPTARAEQASRRRSSSCGPRSRRSRGAGLREDSAPRSPGSCRRRAAPWCRAAPSGLR